MVCVLKLIYKRQKDARVLFKNDRDEEGFNRNDFHCTLLIYFIYKYSGSIF